MLAESKFRKHSFRSVPSVNKYVGAQSRSESSRGKKSRSRVRAMQKMVCLNNPSLTYRVSVCTPPSYMSTRSFDANAWRYFASFQNNLLRQRGNQLKRPNFNFHAEVEKRVLELFSSSSFPTENKENSVNRKVIGNTTPSGSYSGCSVNCCLSKHETGDCR